MATSESETLLYLDDEAAAGNFLDDISGVREIAVDTEGASFHRFVDRIYLLQITTRDSSAIIDPLPLGTLEALGAILQDTDVEVVFHDADYDLRLLHQDYGWNVNHIFDTRIAAQLLGIKAFGLAALLDQIFGVKLDKKHQRADWSLRPLPPGMLDYAAQDTRYLLDLRDELKIRLEKLGRWDWAREEFARLEGTKWEGDESNDGFLRIKGARDLTRRELALLRELVPWRDSVAREIDRATFRVMGNEVLLEIARTAPKTPKDLSGLKGMPRGILDRGATAILSAVQRGLEVAEEHL
ncbi:MAG: HRDC domain-containing protein, partial [Gemmatimonadaceae bacterium]